jgi:hypothetical protein
MPTVYLFARCSGRMTLHYMKTELSREPLHIVDWVRDARRALWHLFATYRTLGRDRNAVFVITHLQFCYLRHEQIVAPTTGGI